MAQLVEEGHHLVVLEKTGLLWGRLGKVAHQGSGREASVAVSIDKALQYISRGLELVHRRINIPAGG